MHLSPVPFLAGAVVSLSAAVAALVEDSTALAWSAVGVSFFTTAGAVLTVWINRGVRAQVEKAVVKIDEVKQETAVIKKDVNSGMTETKNALAEANRIIAEQAGFLAALRTERTAASREADVAAREVEVARLEQPPVAGGSGA